MPIGLTENHSNPQERRLLIAEATGKNHPIVLLFRSLPPVKKKRPFPEPPTTLGLDRQLRALSVPKPAKGPRPLHPILHQVRHRLKREVHALLPEEEDRITLHRQRKLHKNQYIKRNIGIQAQYRSQCQYVGRVLVLFGRSQMQSQEVV